MQSLQKITNQLSIYLLLLFPAFLVTGPFLSELAMNLINIFFLYEIFIKKKFDYFKNKFFIIFVLFYLYIFITIFLSNYSDEIFLKHFFYFRFILFTFAILELLKKNKDLIFLFYKILTITILIVSLDGIFQFIFGYNILGFEQLRHDRLTGFFNDKMILGSYLSRLFPLMVALLIYSYKYLSQNFIILGLITILISFFTILLSGERMALYVNITFIIGIMLFVGISKKIKVSILFCTIIVLSLTIFKSPVLLDRYLNQTKDQVFFNFKKDNFFSNFVFYENIYKTAYNGFIDKKYFGQGARSFRFFCSDENLKSETYHLIDFNFPLLSGKEYIVQSVNAKNGDRVKANEIIFSLIIEGTEKKIYFNNDVIINKLTLQKTDINKKKNKEFIFSYSQVRNGCTSHPHNFYLQLLSETGLIGFLFLISIFFYLIFILLKNSLYILVKKKTYLSNFQIILLIGFIVFLIPIIPNGNFFNNWLNMIIFLPVGFYIYGSKDA